MIETERLLLRPPDAGDVDAIYRILSDPEVTRWIGRNGETGTYDDAVERLERHMRAWDVEPVGRVGLLVWDPETWANGVRAEIGERGEVELGWALERALQPRRLISLIHPANEPSVAVAKRIGERFQHDIVMHHGATVGLWALPSAGA